MVWWNIERNHKTSQQREFPNCNDNRDFPEVSLCLFEYFGCQNIRKETDGRLNVGKDATSIECSSVFVATYIN